MSTADKPAPSAWHEGEIEVQRRAGVRDAADELSGMYKREIPAGMAGFLAQQQFVVLSTQDENHRVWATLVAGTPGMIEIRSRSSLALIASNIETTLPVADIKSDSIVGMIAIDFARRIRVRINGHASVEPNGSVVISIDQLYGNCSQYIQKRIAGDAPAISANPEVSIGRQLTELQQRMIERADTFFLASRHPELGADASHRGGKPGFVQVPSPARLSFPDYSGNNMFNTLGNIAINPAIGLLFVDFESGRTLQVSGRATVDWDRQRAAQFEMAQRVIDVEIDEVRDTPKATSLRYRFIGYSPTLG